MLDTLIAFKHEISYIRENTKQTAGFTLLCLAKGINFWPNF